MKRRLVLSVALVAALYGFWVALAKPACQPGFAASLGKNLKWTCVVQ
jgi:hypothetical protein